MNASEPRQPARRRALWAVLTMTTIAAAAACGDDGPTEVVFQVIEETEFAPSLGIDLASMTLTTTGVYWKDVTVGTGDAATFGTRPFLSYTGWLADGTQFDTGSFNFLMGNNEVVGGFEDGLLNAQVGGTRFMIVPPNRGYGGREIRDGFGNVVIPAGSILVFQATVDSVAPAVGG
jgi:hypothetical protein